MLIDFDTMRALSKTIKEPILNHNEALNNLERINNPSLEDYAIYWASYMKMYNETKTNPEYVENIKNIRKILGYK
jgi:hypothetical protein